MNSPLNLQINKLTDSARVSVNNGVIDLYSDEDVFIRLGETAVIKTNLTVTIPFGVLARVEDRNTLAAAGLKTAGGVISGETTELRVVLNNLTNRTNSGHKGQGYLVKQGEKIAQMSVQPIILVNLNET